MRGRTSGAGVQLDYLVVVTFREGRFFAISGSRTVPRPSKLQGYGTGLRWLRSTRLTRAAAPDGAFRIEDCCLPFSGRSSKLSASSSASWNSRR
jgi:hypothetical protein